MRANQKRVGGPGALFLELKVGQETYLPFLFRLMNIVLKYKRTQEIKKGNIISI